jgi:membrane-bound ClpP family serine protease
MAAGVLIIVAAALMPSDRIVPMIGGTVAIVLGSAFLVAKPITAEHLKSGIADL